MAVVPMCLRSTRAMNVLISGLKRAGPNMWSTRTIIPTSNTEDNSTKTQGLDETISSQVNETETLKQAFEQLRQENVSFSEKVKELEDKYKRALAETENVRQRMQRQIQDAKLFGIQGFCKDLLEVADVLQRAVESVPAEEITEQNPHLKSLYSGLQMTETQLQKVFRTHGLVAISPLGEKFDPNQHEALFEQAVEGKTPGTVALVTKIGYKLHDRTVRPALVGVVKAS